MHQMRRGNGAGDGPNQNCRMTANGRSPGKVRCSAQLAGNPATTAAYVDGHWANVVVVQRSLAAREFVLSLGRGGWEGGGPTYSQAHSGVSLASD